MPRYISLCGCLLPLVCGLWSAGLSHAQQVTFQVNPETGETQQQFAARTKWWRTDKFGMFIHWGLYAVPAGYYHGQPVGGIGEWIMSNAKIPVSEYEQFAPQFNPTQFNAKEWVKIAKDAGMKYIVITSKHHDGFSMFGSKLTKYDIVDATPFHRDPLKELADECKKQGIRLCFYYSVMDWHHPDYLPRREWDTRPASDADYERYIQYMKGQLTELLTHYGDIGVIWFDGGWEGDAARHHSLEVVKMIRSLRPGILINDRINLPEDFSTPEQTIPAGALPNGRLWETCMTMNDTWGFKKDDHNWKSSTDLTRKLIDIASKGGNFLLNVGPQPDGQIPAASVERLKDVGAWMKRNGASIYGTTKSPYRRHPFDGRCTVKGNTMYVHAFSWPDDGVKLTGLHNIPIQSARLLDGGAAVKYQVEHPADGTQTLILEKPAHLDPIATVVEVKLAETPEVVNVQPVIQAGPTGVLTLKAVDADVHGNQLQVQGSGDTQNLGYWTNREDFPVWQAQITQAGSYSLEISYACTPENAGSDYMVVVTKKGRDDGTYKEGTVKSTGDWNRFETENLGSLDLEPGTYTVAVRVKTMPHGAVMNLRQIRLVPSS
jgi:alpha-L-fucosidase